MNSSGLQVHDQIEEKMALLREEAPLALRYRAAVLRCLVIICIYYILLHFITFYFMLLHFITFLLPI